MMIVSLIKPGRIYSYDAYTTCLSVYKSRTLKSMGLETANVDAIDAESVAKVW